MCVYSILDVVDGSTETFSLTQPEVNGPVSERQRTNLKSFHGLLKQRNVNKDTEESSDLSSDSINKSFQKYFSNGADSLLKSEVNRLLPDYQAGLQWRRNLRISKREAPQSMSKDSKSRENTSPSHHHTRSDVSSQARQVRQATTDRSGWHGGYG